MGFVVGEIGDHWLVIKESRLGGQTARDMKKFEIGVKQTF